MFADKPIHFERIGLHKPEVFPSVLSWRCPLVKDRLPADIGEMTFIQYGFGIMEPILNNRELLVQVPIAGIVMMARDPDYPMVDDAWVTTHLMMEYQALMFQHAGKQVFRIMPGLARMLNDTDLDADTDLLQVPYRAFYIEMPPGMFNTWNDVTGIHSVEGIYVCEDPFGVENEDIPRENRDIYMGELLDTTATRMLRIMIVGKSNDPLAPLDDSLFHFRLDIGPGKISQYIDASSEMTRMVRQRGSNNRNLDSLPAMFRLIANTILYINSTHPDIETLMPDKFLDIRAKQNRFPKGHRKRAWYQEKLKHHTSVPRIVLGSTVEYTEPVDSEGRRLSVKFQVRGHWRSFRADRYKEGVRGKTIWIRPYWKGPDMAEELDRKYHVGSA